MFEEAEFLLNGPQSRINACMRQCRQLRLNIDQGGNCPCDVLAECRFKSGPSDVWFPDKLRYYQELASE